MRQPTRKTTGSGYLSYNLLRSSEFTAVRMVITMKITSELKELRHSSPFRYLIRSPSSCSRIL